MPENNRSTHGSVFSNARARAGIRNRWVQTLDRVPMERWLRDCVRFRFSNHNTRIFITRMHDTFERYNSLTMGMAERVRQIMSEGRWEDYEAIMNIHLGGGNPAGWRYGHHVISDDMVVRYELRDELIHSFPVWQATDGDEIEDHEEGMPEDAWNIFRERTQAMSDGMRSAEDAAIAFGEAARQVEEVLGTAQVSAEAGEMFTVLLNPTALDPDVATHTFSPADYGGESDRVFSISRRGDRIPDTDPEVAPSPHTEHRINNGLYQYNADDDDDYSFSFLIYTVQGGTLRHRRVVKVQYVSESSQWAAVAFVEPDGSLRLWRRFHDQREERWCRAMFDCFDEYNSRSCGAFGTPDVISGLTIDASCMCCNTLMTSTIQTLEWAREGICQRCVESDRNLDHLMPYMTQRQWNFIVSRRVNLEQTARANQRFAEASAVGVPTSERVPLVRPRTRRVTNTNPTSSPVSELGGGWIK